VDAGKDRVTGDEHRERDTGDHVAGLRGEKGMRRAPNRVTLAKEIVHKIH
jgi:hypothetical protein